MLVEVMKVYTTATNSILTSIFRTCDMGQQLFTILTVDGEGRGNFGLPFWICLGTKLRKFRKLGTPKQLQKPIYIYIKRR